MKRIIYSILISTLVYSCSDSRTQECTDYIAANFNPSVVPLEIASRKFEPILS